MIKFYYLLLFLCYPFLTIQNNSLQSYSDIGLFCEVTPGGELYALTLQDGAYSIHRFEPTMQKFTSFSKTQEGKGDYALDLVNYRMVSMNKGFKMSDLDLINDVSEQRNLEIENQVILLAFDYKSRLFGLTEDYSLVMIGPNGSVEFLYNFTNISGCTIHRDVRTIDFKNNVFIFIVDCDGTKSFISAKTEPGSGHNFINFPVEDNHIDFLSIHYDPILAKIRGVAINGTLPYTYFLAFNYQESTITFTDKRYLGLISGVAGTSAIDIDNSL